MVPNGGGCQNSTTESLNQRYEQVYSSCRTPIKPHVSTHLNWNGISRGCICSQMRATCKHVTSLLIICNFPERFLCQLQQKSTYCLVIGLFLLWLLNPPPPGATPPPFPRLPQCHQCVPARISMEWFLQVAFLKLTAPCVCCRLIR